MRLQRIKGLVIASALLLCACGSEVASADSEAVVERPETVEHGWAYAALADDARRGLAACGVDGAEFARLMALSQTAFDQDFQGGWRKVAQRHDCKNSAGDLILAYMHYSTPTAPQDIGLLRWHAGQMKAYAGETDQALALFSGTYEDTDGVLWNLYVDATLAFLRNDLAGIETAYALLSAVEVSNEEKAERQRFLNNNPDITMPDGFVTEPQNLAVVRRLRDCFGHPYETAYGGCD